MIVLSLLQLLVIILAVLHLLPLLHAGAYLIQTMTLFVFVVKVIPVGQHLVAHRRDHRVERGRWDVALSSFLTRRPGTRLADACTARVAAARLRWMTMHVWVHRLLVNKRLSLVVLRHRRLFVSAPKRRRLETSLQCGLLLCHWQIHQVLRLSRRRLLMLLVEFILRVLFLGHAVSARRC